MKQTLHQPPARPAAQTRSLAAVCLLAACTATLFAPAAHAEWVSRTVDGIMGTRIFVELWSDDAAAGQRAIDAVMDEMRRIDESMSTFKPTSEVSKVNGLAAKQAVVVSPELFQLLQT